jgi:hypothetical protein
MSDAEETGASRDPGGMEPCCCGQDPMGALPPELRPAPPSALSGLRSAKCPRCGLEFWTNRPTDVCSRCEYQHPTPHP